MAQRKLHAVPAKVMTVAEAAEGTDLEMLVALRARMATTIDDPKTPPAALAALSLRLIDVAREIKTLSEVGNDDIAEATRVPDAGFSAASV